MKLAWYLGSPFCSLWLHESGSRNFSPAKGTGQTAFRSGSDRGACECSNHRCFHPDYVSSQNTLCPMGTLSTVEIASELSCLPGTFIARSKYSSRLANQE